jgi:release factor glutamine methyltransferase
LTIGAIGEILRKNKNNRDHILALQHITGYSFAGLLAHDHDSLSSQQSADYQSIIEQLESDIPLAYILGIQHFYEHTFLVNPDVLIPRPDTEVLVDFVISTALTMLNNKKQNNPLDSATLNILELGTGSGCIALSIEQALLKHSAHQNNIKIIATDISEPALIVAESNAENLKSKVQFIKSDWFENIPITTNNAEKFDIIVSNPPYIDSKDAHLLQLVQEPLGALTDHQNGLFCLTRIIANSAYYMKSKAVIALEHGYDQGLKVQNLLQQHGMTEVGLMYDYGNNPRVSFGTIP